jgi:hypothetical protein
MPESTRRPPVNRACALAFLAAGVTLFIQVLAHRMVSAKLLNNFAFLVISLTMLGFALSGVILTKALPRVLARLGDSVTLFSSLFALSFVLISSVFYGAQAEVFYGGAPPEAVRQILTTFPFALLYAIPFLFAGLILGTLLGAPDLPTARIYGFDLAGSSLGALVVIPAISNVGVERASLIACALLVGGTLLTLPPDGVFARLVGGLTLLALLASFPFQDRIFALRYPKGTVLAQTQVPNPRSHVEFTSWDPVARIEVTKVPPPTLETLVFPCLTGDYKPLLDRMQYLITQNNHAYTWAVHYTGAKEDLAGIDRTIYAAAYEARTVPNPRVLVIGVGGGFDILNALYFDTRKVTGVEINAATVGILRHAFHDYFKAWVEDPRVEIANREGRNYLATSPEQFDVIQLSGVDSYSGTPGAANVFSESYLYTQEAFDLYLSKLTPNGVLNVMRLEHKPAREMLKALVTAAISLKRVGVARPEDHIAMLSSTDRSFTALLVKKSPFTEAELGRLRSWAAASPFFDFVAGGGERPDPPNAYALFLSNPPETEGVFVEKYPYDIRAVDDNRPFFFRFSYWWHLFPTDPRIWAQAPVFELTLIILVAVVGAMALICVYAPLWLMGTPRLFEEGRWRYGVYCAGIALGYLAIEVAFLQKFGLLLGHPNYCLSVVLAVLLLASGLGALSSERIVRFLGNVRFAGYALAAAMLFESYVVFPSLPGLIGLPFPVRVAIVVVVVAPVGLLLGVFFPTVLERVKQRIPAFVPWAWGINGIFSVLAPLLSVAFSETWGINALFLSAIPAYLVAVLALP